MQIKREALDFEILFGILKRRIGVVLIFATLGLLFSAVVTYIFITPIYQAKTQVIVRSAVNLDGKTMAQDIQGNVQIINTYNDIFVSPIILNQVIDRLHLNTTSGALQRRIKLTTETDSQVITITVQGRNQFEAKDIANTTVEIFQNEVVKIMHVDNVAVLAPAVATENPPPVSPNKKLNLAIGVLLGLVIGISFAFLREILDKSIKSSEEIEALTGLPVLGEIPDLQINIREVE